MNEPVYFLTPEDYDLAAKNGIPRKIAHQRFYNQGMTRDRAVTKPYKPRDKETSKWAKIAEANGISRQLFYSRIRPLDKPGNNRTRQWGLQEAATTPPMDLALVAKQNTINKMKNFTPEQLERAKATGYWQTIRHRVQNLGWDVERAIATPVDKRFWRKELKKNEKSQSVR